MLNGQLKPGYNIQVGTENWKYDAEQEAKVGTEWGLLMLGYDFKQLIRLMNA